MDVNAIKESCDSMLKGLQGMQSEIMKGIKKTYENDPKAMEQFNEALKSSDLDRVAKEAVNEILKANKENANS